MEKSCRYSQKDLSTSLEMTPGALVGFIALPGHHNLRV